MYNRSAAVAYAQTWWNGENPYFPTFSVDCANFVSQCLLAGGAPMWGASNRGRGWWITGGWKSGSTRAGFYPNETWSYSWSVAHSLRWYLQTSRTGLTAKRVDSPTELEPGDVILYDFQGNGVVDHSAIVTSVIDGIPYVNAHTNNSQNRHYEYRNSAAYTPNIEYFFFKINDVFNS